MFLFIWLSLSSSTWDLVPADRPDPGEPRAPCIRSAVLATDHQGSPHARCLLNLLAIENIRIDKTK